MKVEKLDVQKSEIPIENPKIPKAKFYMVASYDDTLNFEWQYPCVYTSRNEAMKGADFDKERSRIYEIELPEVEL